MSDAVGKIVTDLEAIRATDGLQFILDKKSEKEKSAILNLFETLYGKFLDTVKMYDLISEDTDKVAIGMSGGKDAQIVTLFLNEYKKRERPDLEIEIINVASPGWKYRPLDYFAGDKEHAEYANEQNQYIKNTEDYWKNKGLEYTYLKQCEELTDEKIKASRKPCVWCFIGMYRTMFDYLKKEHDKGKKIVLANGVTKLDLLYVMTSLVIRSGGKTWSDDKENNPSRYYFAQQQLACFSPYPKIKIGIPGTDICRISPIINLTDNETRALANALELPRIPDPCSKLFGTKFESDKRHFDRYLEGTTTEKIDLNHVNSGFFEDYQGLIDIYTRAGVLPPVEEIDNILYKALYDEQILRVFRD